jgi:uncharacterized coiled-coil DUF342 family protein
MSIPSSNWEENWEGHRVLSNRREHAADLRKEIEGMKEQMANLQYDLDEKAQELVRIEASIEDLESTL